MLENETDLSVKEPSELPMVEGKHLSILTNFVLCWQGNYATVHQLKSAMIIAVMNVI